MSTTDKPSVLPVKPGGIPATLKAIAQWVCWRLEFRDGKWTKVPYQPSGIRAKSDNAETWSTFDAAFSAYQTGNYSGVGFVFSADDDFSGLDLDHCIDGDKFAEWAVEIAGEFNTYAERSPSGTGLRMMMLGAKPTKRCTKNGYPNGGKVEVFDHERYFTLTGHALPDFPAEVNDCQPALTALCERLFAAEPDPEKKQVAAPAQHSADDRAIIDKVCSQPRFEQLWRGDISAYDNDESAADLALCGRIAFYCGNDPARIDSVFRESSLVREKWTNRADYRDRTISKAIAGCRDFYQWNGNGHDSGSRSHDKTGSKPHDPIERFLFKQLRADYPTLNPPVVDGLFRLGETFNIISASKVGKSWLLYSLLLSIVTGRMWLGRFTTTKGKCILIDNELHRSTLAYRIPQVAAAMGITSSEYENDLEVWPLRGNLRGLAEMYSDFKRIPHGSVQLIAFDAKYRLATDDENSNSSETRFYNDIDQIAAMTGAAVGLVHHSSKGGQASKSITDVGAGAGAQSRACDAHIILREHEDEGCAVMEAALRSFAPLEPVGVRWTFPVWRLADEIDVKKLKGLKTEREQNKRTEDVETMQKLQECLKSEPATIRVLLGKVGRSRPVVERLLDALEAAGKVDWTEVKIRGNSCRQYSMK